MYALLQWSSRGCAKTFGPRLSDAAGLPEGKRKSLLVAILAATSAKTVISRVVYTVARGDRQCVE